MARRDFLAFFAGFFSCAVLLYIIFYSGLTPLGTGMASLNTIAPSDWITEDNITVFDNMVVIKVKDASITSYAPTGSMRPLLDSDSNGIRIVPEDENQIHVGDIVSFERDNILVVHRIIEKGEDEQGTYFIAQGDNTSIEDGKIRFKDIKYVTIGVLW